MNTHDVIVIGAGSMGSAALYHLAKGGCRVLGIERHAVPHDQGSYHGESRLTRYAYSQGEAYVPLLLRSRALWHALGEEAGEKLLHETGCLSICSPDRETYIENVFKSIKRYSLPHRVMTGKDVNALYPAFRLPEDFVAIYDEWAGYILSEKAVAAHVKAARRHGAEIRTGERVVSWSAGSAGVEVKTDKDVYSAGKLVVSPGAWFAHFVPEYAKHLKTLRVALSWYKPAKPELFMPDRLPIFIMNDGKGFNGHGCYGVPICGGVPGMKIGHHCHRDEVVDAEHLDRSPRPEDEEMMRHWTDNYFDLKGAPCLGMKICMYTMTPDEAFILGPHPAHGNVILGHACSGHGFKFSSVIGEILADLALRGKTGHDISAHDPARF